MQPELAPEEVPELAPEAVEQQGPGPAPLPPGGLLEKVYNDIKQSKLKGVAENLPEDYYEFEAGMLDDPENIKALQSVFKQEKWEGADLPEQEFSRLMLDGVKKKALSADGGAAAGESGAPGFVPPGLASPTPTTPTLPDATSFGEPVGVQPGDQEFTQDDVPLPGGPEAVGVGDAPPDLAMQPTPGSEVDPAVSVERAPSPEEQAVLQQLPGDARAELATNGAGGKLFANRGDIPEVKDGETRVRIPEDYRGAVPLNTYTIPASTEPGARYFDRPLSKQVDGEGEQGLLMAALRNTNNLVADGFKGLATGLDDASQLISSATGASRGGAFADVAAALETTKKPVAEYYKAHDFMAHPNAKNLLMGASDVAGMAVPLVAQALAPEAGAGRLVTQALGTGAGLMFDGQIIQGAHDRAKAAGMDAQQTAIYTLLDAGLSLATFKLGGAALGGVASKLTPAAVKSEVMREAYRILATREAGKQLTRTELQGVLAQATAAATPKLLKVVAEGGKLGTLFGVNEAKTILTEAAARQAIGAKFTQPTLSEAVKRVVGATAEGSVIGAATGAATPTPARTNVLRLGSTGTGRSLSAELDAKGQPARFLDEQGAEVDFGPKGPPPAVVQAVAAAKATPTPLAATDLNGHQRVPTGKYVGNEELYADYSLQGKATKLYTKGGQVFALDDPQVRTLVESKWPDAPKEKEGERVQKKPEPVPIEPKPAESVRETPESVQVSEENAPASVAADSVPPELASFASAPTDPQQRVIAQQFVQRLEGATEPQAVAQRERVRQLLDQTAEAAAQENSQFMSNMLAQAGTSEPISTNEPILEQTPGTEPGNETPSGGANGTTASAPESASSGVDTNTGPESASGGGPILSEGVGENPSTPKPYATPSENRAAGAFEKDGQVYTRQAPLGERVARGKAATAEFSSGVQQPVQYAVMEAADLQPSHLGGNQNLNHFLPEAQPKNRSAAFDPASQKAIADIGASPDLNRLGESPNAYSGAPIVNQRGEALQGNGRAAGVRAHYKQGGESYKRDVVAAAEKVGISAEKTAGFKEPVLVRIADVSDAKARELGNYTAADTESGGKRRLDPRQAAGRMDDEGRATLTRLATPKGDATLTETIRGNAPELLRFLRKAGLVNETQLQTMAKPDGTLTPQGVEDVAALYRFQLFRDGDPNLPELFTELPSAAQGGLDRAVGALLSVPESASVVPEVQDALYGVREFLASGTDFNTWAGQADMFKGGQAPRERYSPLSLKLVEVFTTEKRPTYIARLFNEYAAAVKGAGASLFAETPPTPRAEAVENTFGVADAARNSRAEESAPRPGDANERPTAPEPQPAPGATGAAEPAPEPALADNPAQRAGGQASAAEGVGDTRASGPKFYADLAEAPPVMNQPGRIAPDPIRGEKPKEQGKIILDLRKSTGVSIFFSKRPGGKRGRALGSYNPRNAAVAIKAENDLDVTAHELGHALDDSYDLLPKAPAAALAEIQPLARFGSTPPASHPDPTSYRNGEAVAEYLRTYLVNPDATRTTYPEFTKHYETTVPAKMRGSVESFGRDIRVFAGATAHEQVMSNVRMKPAEPGGILATLKPETAGNGGKFMLTFGDRVQATMLNALHPFEKAMRYAQETTGQADILPEDNPVTLARLFSGLNDKMDDMMRDGLVDSRNERRIDQQTGQVKNLTWLLDPLDKTTTGTIEAEQELVVSAKIARRTVELAERMVPAEIERLLAEGKYVDDAFLQSNPKWQQQFGAQNAANKATLFPVEGKVKDYETATVSGIGAGVFTDLAVARQRLTDHEALAVSNPEQHARIEEAGRRYESWADDNMQYLVERGRISQDQYDMIKENNAQYIALQRVMEAEPGAEIEVFGRGPGGKSFIKEKQPLKAITGKSGRLIKNPYSSLLDATYQVTREADRNAIMQSFRELFTGSRVMYDGQVEDLASVAREVGEGEPHSVTVYVKGQREFWQLDADVFEAVNEISNTPLDGPLAKVLQSPAKLLRWTVTNSPVFAARNLIRDTRSRLIVSTNTPEAGFDLLTNKQARLDAKSGLNLAGGGQAGHYLSSDQAYYDTMQQTMRSLAKDKRFILADPGKWASSAWHNYTRLLGGSETIGRRMEYRAAYKKARAQKMDHYNASLYAALEARDLMDFAVAGTFMRQLNKYVPFTNAAVQGLRRAAKSAVDNPAAFAGRWALYSLVPTILVRGLIHKMGRDDEYAQFPSYMRDGFDGIPLPKGRWLMIPRPFELGTLAASADRFLSQQVAEDPHAWEGYGKSLSKSFVPVDESAVAGGLKPIIEVLTNHDFFKDKSIISPAEAKLDVDLRHTERGSRLGQWIGGAVGMDSRNVDHLISGTGSYYGNWLMKASNFGRTDGQTFGLPDTGFLKDQPVTQARDVQWLEQKLAGAGLDQSKPSRNLQKILQLYYAQKTDADRQQVGELATEYAKQLREVLDADLVKQVGQAQKARKDSQKR